MNMVTAKNRQKILKKEFEFSYDPPLNSGDGTITTHESYNVTGIVNIEKVFTTLESGVKSEIRVTATIHEIREYQNDAPGTNTITLQELARKHSKMPFYSRMESMRKDMIKAFIDTAVDDEFGRTSVAEYLYHRL